MSTRRWAGAGFGLLMVGFSAAGGCGGDDSTGDNDAGLGGDSSVCSDVVVKGCHRVQQNGVEFDLECSSIVNKPVNGRAVCAISGQCVGTPTPCLDPMTVHSCLQSCTTKQDGGGDAGSSPLGTSCAATADCRGGLTCLKPTDNLVPGAGPPNGLCTAECSTTANQDLCKSLAGICVGFSATGAGKAFCVEPCTTGAANPPESKCHGRLDMVCGPLSTPGSFACQPLCATDSDCATRKCDFGTGYCSDVVTPGAAIGSSCIRDSDCAGAFCYPFEITDAAFSAGVCTAICRLGNLEACGFRTTPLDAGPAVGACLLGSSTAADGDVGICAQLCDTVNDCSTNDPRWNCLLDAGVRSAFGHAGYCWLGARPEGGTRDAAAPEPVPEAGAPEASPPEASPPEASTDSANDVTTSDGNPSDAVTPPPDGAAD